MYCPKCNCINHYDNVFCTRCGAVLTPKKEKTETQTTKEQSSGNSTSYSQSGNANHSQNGNASYSQTTFSQPYSNNMTSPNMANPSYYQQNVAPISAKSRGVAAVLCFWFGFLGIHRFYAGKILTGLLWMFTLGLFGFGSISDFIMIACGSFKDCYGYKIK